jgi:hypothetical protein
MDAIDRMIAQSIITIERSYALLSRVDAKLYNCHLCGRLQFQPAGPDRAESRPLPGL